jgi:hypothetical protein
MNRITIILWLGKTNKVNFCIYRRYSYYLFLNLSSMEVIAKKLNSTPVAVIGSACRDLFVWTDAGTGIRTIFMFAYVAFTGLSHETYCSETRDNKTRRERKGYMLTIVQVFSREIFLTTAMIREICACRWGGEERMITQSNYILYRYQGNKSSY